MWRMKELIITFFIIALVLLPGCNSITGAGIFCDIFGGCDDDGGTPEQLCANQGGTWEPNTGDCCIHECGKISGGGRFICGQIQRAWRWFDARKYSGSILDMECAALDTVSTGAIWRKCASNSDFGSTTIRGHQYMCVPATIHECAGETSPFSRQGSRTGNSINKGGNTYYCTSDAKWITDLDITDPLSCEKAGFKWTNNLCCSEADDRPSEYYNDLGGEGTRRGACFSSTWMDDGFFPTRADPQTAFTGDVLVVNGEFFGCAVGDSQTGQNNQELLLLKDTHTKEQLIKNKEKCTAVEDAKGAEDFFCSVEGLWKESDTTEERVIKQIAWEQETEELVEECCPALDCWDGNGCVQNQRGSARFETTNGLRCIDGVWTRQDLRYTWDFFNIGLCLEDSDCLVNPEGKAENDYNPDTYFFEHPNNDPQCISNGQSILDNNCQQGIWESRTEIIALQLLDLAEAKTDSYELFCGSYEEVLNHVDYQPLPGIGTVEQYISTTCPKGTTNVPCVNNFCAITFNDPQLGLVNAFGTTLNHQIDGQKSFLLALGKETTLCNNLSGSTFKQCSDSNIYFNPELKAIIFNPLESLQSKSPSQLKEQHRSKFITQEDLLTQYSTTLATDVDFAFLTNSTSQRRNIYYAKKPGKKAYAIFIPNVFDRAANIFRSVIGAKFDNINAQDEFGIDACDLIKQFHLKTGEDFQLSQVHCLTDGRNTLSISFGTAGEFPLKNAWRDLTAKLRLKQ